MWYRVKWCAWSRLLGSLPAREKFAYIIPVSSPSPREFSCVLEPESARQISTEAFNSLCKSQSLLDALRIKKLTSSNIKYSWVPAAKPITFSPTMFTSRRTHQSESFSKHRASKSVSKSKRSFRDHATSIKKTEKSSRPGTSPATGR